MTTRMFLLSVVSFLSSDAASAIALNIGKSRLFSFDGRDRTTCTIPSCNDVILIRSLMLIVLFGDCLSLQLVDSKELVSTALEVLAL